MNMKGFIKGIVSFILVIFMTALTFSSIPRTVVEAKPDSTNYKNISEKWTLLNDIADKVEAKQFFKVNEAPLNLQNDGVKLEVDDKLKFKMNIPNDGEYNLVLQYKVNDTKILKNSVSLKWEDEEITTSVPSIWRDETKEYGKDRYGNDVIPEQIKLEEMHLEFVEDFSSIDKTPKIFNFKKGELEFILENQTQTITLSAVYLVKAKSIPSYKEYLKKISKNNSGKGVVTIEAEDYIGKSDVAIRPANSKDIDVSPYDSEYKKINIIDGNGWTQPGQKIMWEFNIEESGFYTIGFKYAQMVKEGMPVFRSIEIDGENIFNELKEQIFPYTKYDYKEMVIENSDGEDYKIWLDKGTHTISMKANASSIQEIYSELNDMMFEVSSIGTDIKKLTGGNVDANRTWSIKEYMPDIVENLEGLSTRLYEIYKLLEDISGEEPVFAFNLKLAAESLKEISEKPEKIPNNLNKLSEGSGSAAQLIGDTVQSLAKQPLTLDRIYILGEGEEIPSTNTSVLTRVWEGTKGFVKSFLPSNNEYNDVSGNKNTDELTVWVNRPIHYVELMQQMVDSKFTSETGIKVKFSLMPNEQKLVLANASGTNPDVALSVSKDIPYQLAIRGASADLTKFEDFYSYMNKEYNIETLIPYTYENKVYGVAETMDFQVLMYRKDILEKLNTPIPNTWNDIKNIMPELQRNSMNFYTSLSASSGIKTLGATSPFIFQNSGELYNEDGLSVNLNSEEAIKGFELMTELFTIYSVAQNSPNFYNNFRYGLMPLGISSFNTYVMLTNAAPEIAGLWDIALAPGIEKVDGTIDRSQIAVERSSFIFENSNRKEDAWKFLKWWLSKETQVDFAYSLQNKYGPEYMWNTANIEAFKGLPFPEEHKKVILEQWKHIKEVPPHPAAYIVEREISNAWTDVVMNGVNLRVAVDKAKITANREITRKMEEFGYVENGQKVKNFSVPNKEIYDKR